MAHRPRIGWRASGTYTERRDTSPSPILCPECQRRCSYEPPQDRYVCPDHGPQASGQVARAWRLEVVWVPCEPCAGQGRIYHPSRAGYHRICRVCLGVGSVMQ